MPDAAHRKHGHMPSPQPDYQMAEELVIDDLETLKVIADPLRLRILELMHKPQTVKKIARKLEMTPTKLYYHINLLEKHGLIVLVDTRLVSGIIEKHYLAAARGFRLASALLSPEETGESEALVITLDGLFAGTKQDILRALRQGILQPEHEQPTRHLKFWQGGLHLTPEQAQEFYDRVEALWAEYLELSHQQRDSLPECQSYQTLYMLWPSLYEHDTED